MKLYNIYVGTEIHVAVAGVNGIVDATAHGYTGTMDEIIAGGDTSALKAAAADTSASAVEAPVFANVVCKPGKLLCIGLNYAAHAEGVKSQLTALPTIFSKFADVLTPCGAAIELPAWEETYDYEAELVIVIGKTAWNAGRDEAKSAIFGYTCGNDMSARGPQKQTSQWLIGKNFPGFGPCGPCIATADSLDPEAGISIKSYVNGELRQDGSTADMLFKPADIVSTVSKYVRLEPGDLIFTGTPAGVVLEKKPEERKWLVPGDRVDVVIEGIGTLTNTMK